MANFDLTDAAALIKRLYKPGVIGDVVSADNAALNLLPKFKELQGSEQVRPVQSGYVQNTASDATAAFSTTYATASAIVDAFRVTPCRILNRATIDHMAMALSQSDAGAFLSTAKVQIDGALKARGANLETQIFRAGWGDIGVIATAGVSGATFTLATTDDVVNFEKGMKLVFAASQATDALRSATPITVTGVNRTTGVVTCDTALATPGAVAGDWVFIYGDRQNSASAAKIVPTGFDGWIPTTAPTSATFFGVDRSTDPTRLGGLRLDGDGGDLVELVNTAAGMTDLEGRAFSHLFMGSKVYAAFVNMLGSKYQYQGVNLKGSDELSVGISGIKFLSNFGEIKVVPSRKCPTSKMYGLNLKSWQLSSQGEPIRLFDEDAKMLRVTGDDVYEVRVGGYVNINCNEPGSNIVIYNVSI